MRIVSWQQLDLQLIAVTFSRLLHLLSPPFNAAFLTAISPSTWITLSECLDRALPISCLLYSSSIAYGLLAAPRT